jgi:succinyl-diaminopimelate desuccinylase
MGRNAIHRLGDLLVALDRAEVRRPVIQGCEFHEALQAVAIEGGVSGNVVPDRATVTIAHRFAPDHDAAAAEGLLRRVLEPHLEPGDEIEVVDVAPAAHPSLDQPLLASLIARHQLAVRSKLGWTDVARFASLGIPAANFGPGDPTLAHTAEEHVTRSSLDRVWAVVDDVVTTGI